jgi:hypothetical protein
MKILVIMTLKRIFETKHCTLLFPAAEVYSVGEDPKNEEEAEPGVQLGVAQQAHHHVSKIKAIFGAG